MMSALFRCVHSWLRPLPALGRRRRLERDRPRASAARRNGSTACSRSCRRRPGAARGFASRIGQLVLEARRRTRRLQPGGPATISSNWSKSPATCAIREAQANHGTGRPREHRGRERKAALVPRTQWIDGRVIAAHDVIMKRILEISRRPAPCQRADGDSSRFRRRAARHRARSAGNTSPRPRCRARSVLFPAGVISGLARRERLPRPGIAKPELRQKVEHGRFRAAIVDRHPEQGVVGRGLGIFHEDVEIAIRVEDAGVEKLEFRLISAATAILGAQPRVGKLLLRILVQHLHVGMRRRGVEIVVQLLDVFAVVAFRLARPKSRSLRMGSWPFQNARRQAEPALIVGPAGDSVFAPAVGALMSMIEREVPPAIAVGAIVFPDGAPLAVGDIRPPEPPRGRHGARFVQTKLLGGFFHAESDGEFKGARHRAPRTSLGSVSYVFCVAGSNTDGPIMAVRRRKTW